MKNDSQIISRKETLYQEYARLGNCVLELVESAFGDFKLLGAVATVAAAGPAIAVQILGTAASEAGLLFFISTLALLVFVAVGLFNLMKRIQIDHYLDEMKRYGRALEDPQPDVFDAPRLWNEKWKSKHLRVFFVYSHVLWIVVTFAPAWVLGSRDPGWAAGYVAMAVAAYAGMWWLWKRSEGEPNRS